MADAIKRIGTWRNLRNVAADARPRRFLAYCSWRGRKHYDLLVQVAMLQVTAGRRASDQ